ncbi:GNAT family N-acetyltransferase [Kitasatospora sp. NPDC048540]|uniref:GNAT family N-acetyltransferase n=1 Tax=unclassified Kitasatospora TaxID=2633591 RepID=UPI0011EA6466|nr:GNAT family N-acetyltransferase [Kitasatospora sp. MBT63]
MSTYLMTDRLVLRPFTGAAADVDLLTELNSDPAVMRYLTGGRPVPREVVEREVLPGYLDTYRRNPSFGHWAAIDRAGGEFLGWFEFRLDPAPGPDGRQEGGRDQGRDVELGYRLRQAAWGRGYATEGSLALIRHGFTALGVARVHAVTMAVNRGSRRVMEKAGLRLVRTFHEDWDEPVEGAEHGEVEYALERADWRP